MLKVKKAIFPVAGLGTRFLPATKAIPKEMFPVVDKPLIQYAVEEAIESGITEMIFVTGRSKRAIEDHFDKSYEIEFQLKERGNSKLLELMQNIKPSYIDCFYVRQSEALGLGHAILCAEKLIGNNPFAVILADDLLYGKSPVIKQSINIFNRYNKSVICIEEILSKDTMLYGIVNGKEYEDSIVNISSIEEKPSPELALSNLGIVGRYVFHPNIFKYLRMIKPCLSGEVQLTDAIQLLLVDEEVLAYKYDGTRFDCGSKLGYLKANIDFAMRHPELAVSFSSYIKKYLFS